ncbi:hypothetical protein JQ596_26145 [Bradyrhizobium manausense]|uniref:hypothetical protein n=1 Tax=Bradyrhizobium TaxID=374 RepID=UPI001BA63F45|nr:MULTISPECIES: hypothetical protein [Bradyrhizobium]MBR0829022.1 hypothetical protein [Bradyrhizobium manausense]UVO27974.1 hypothetical protein KUF59_36795 [Bradyrhizobium arachidis]
MNELGTIDGALDEMLVNLAGIVLRLSSPAITNTPDTRQALARSVHQYAVCASRSADPRVHALKAQLEATLKPRLRVIVSNGAKSKVP